MKNITGENFISIIFYSPRRYLQKLYSQMNYAQRNIKLFWFFKFFFNAVRWFSFPLLRLWRNCKVRTMKIYCLNYFPFCFHHDKCSYSMLRDELMRRFKSRVRSWMIEIVVVSSQAEMCFDGQNLIFNSDIYMSFVKNIVIMFCLISLSLSFRVFCVLLFCSQQED